MILLHRGLLARSVLTAQNASPTFSHVYAALVAVVNTKFPQTGELIAKRLIIQFKKSFRRSNKNLCLSTVRFIAHLVNQQVLKPFHCSYIIVCTCILVNPFNLFFFFSFKVLHELLSLEILTLLLEDPTNDSVEVAIGFLKECGLKLTDLSPTGIHGELLSLWWY